jgi:hypothetical protein
LIVQQPYIPIFELWPPHRNGLSEIAAVLVGYMDESYDGSAIPKVFNLSCLVSSILGWIYFDWQWHKVLDEKNQELRSQGRKELSRFHAQDINNFAGDYKDWDGPERQSFCEKLTGVFHRNPVHIHGWDMPLDVLVEVIPEAKPNPIGLAYCVLLGELMAQMGETTLSLPDYKTDSFSLHHEHCKYDASLLDWFNLLLDDGKFKFRHRYTSITPERWEFCGPLQPADLIAYENFKEGMRFHVPDSKEAKRGRMRLSLEAIINLDSISGRSRGYSREMIQDLKQKLDKDPDTKQGLFRAARIIQ